MNRSASILLSLPAWVLMTGIGFWGGASPASEGVPRFHPVTQNLFRGGQPSQAGLEFLKNQGIKTVVNLRSENQEQEAVEKLGMKYVHIPLSAWGSVGEEAIQTFLKATRDSEQGPVFVHCERGADRTGFMVALYRIAVQGWNADQAYGEARALGMRWWYRGLKSQLYKFAEQHAAAQRAAPPE